MIFKFQAKYGKNEPKLFSKKINLSHYISFEAMDEQAAS